MEHNEKYFAVALQLERKKVEMLRKAIENEVCYFCQKKVRRYLAELAEQVTTIEEVKDADRHE